MARFCSTWLRFDDLTVREPKPSQVPSTEYQITKACQIAAEHGLKNKRSSLATFEPKIYVATTTLFRRISAKPSLVRIVESY